MRNLTEQDLTKLWPQSSVALRDGVLATQVKAFEIAEITKAIRLAHFLAQISHESGGGTILRENLNYRAQRLMAVWPNRFPTLQSARPYEHNPEALANKVYGGRMGNVQPGDGYRFRGRGLIQITGRDGYKNVGEIAGLDLVGNPDLAIDPDHIFIVAAAFWKWKTGINTAADSDDLLRVTKKVNGGTNGLADRKMWLGKCKKQLGLISSNLVGV